MLFLFMDIFRRFWKCSDVETTLFSERRNEKWKKEKQK